jgi:outer membrane protein assembly factor BamB
MWKFDPEARQAYTGPDLLTRGAGTGSGCAGVWSSPAVDVAGGLVFFGTASCNGDVRNGAESMWAVRLVDGSLVWTYAPPRTTLRYDDDFGASPNLLPGGLVGEGSKDGVYHVRHRATGLPAFAAHVGQSGQAMDDFSVGGMIGSAAVGRVGDEPAVFITTAIGTPLDLPVGADGGPTPDPTVAQDPGRLLSIHAISARDGRVLWRSPISRQTYGAASYANGVVFVTSTVGSSVTAYDADTGVALWSGPVVGPSSSTPVVAGDSLYLGAGTQTGQVAGVWAYRLIGG